MIGRQYPSWHRGDDNDIADALLRSVFGSPFVCGCESDEDDELLFSYAIADTRNHRELRIELTASGYGTISVDSLGDGGIDPCMTFVTSPARTQMIANALTMMADTQRVARGEATHD